MTPQLLTNSRKKAVRRCKRYAYYQYEINRRPVEKAEPLWFGAAWHDLLECWWSALMGLVVEDKTGRWPLDVALAALSQMHDLDPYARVKLEVMIVGYHTRWYDYITDRFTVLEVEVEFQCPLVNPTTGKHSRTFELGGKIDAIVFDRVLGIVCIVEHKSTTYSLDGDSGYWPRLRLDSQISDYYIGAKSLGHDAESCLYDVSRKPGLKPQKATHEDDRKYTIARACKRCVAAAKKATKKANLELPRHLKEPVPRTTQVPLTPDCPDCQPSRLYATMREHDETPDEYRDRLVASMAESPDSYFAMRSVARLDEDLEEHRLDSWQQAKLLRECQKLQAVAEAKGIDPRSAWPKAPEHCFDFQRACCYHVVCTRQRTIDDNELFETTDAHPELEVLGIGNISRAKSSATPESANP
jgi:hypothetical protein